jgi:gliding motility associated protien GldN
MNILKSYRLLASASLLLVSGVAFAQGNTNMTDQPTTQSAAPAAVNSGWKSSLVTDGAYDQVAHVNRILPWQPVREADVLWKKRIWREIDIRQKQNMAFRYPGDDNTGGGMFIEILIDAVKKGKVKAYSTVDDRFTSALTKEQILEGLTGKPDTIPVVDPITGETTYKIVQNDFNPDVVTRFRLKEDWIFDRNLGRMVVRIIGLAPLKDI